MPEPIQYKHGMFEYGIHHLSQSIIGKLAKPPVRATEKAWIRETDFPPPPMNRTFRWIREPFSPGIGFEDCRVHCQKSALYSVLLHFPALIRAKKEPGSNCLEPGIYLATTYSHKTYRLTTIGAAAFHFRVRNGTGWFHRALVTRGQFQGQVFCFWNWDSGDLELGLKLRRSAPVAFSREAKTSFLITDY